MLQNTSAMTRCLTLCWLGFWLGLCTTGLSAQSTFGIHAGATYGKYQASNPQPDILVANWAADIGYVAGLEATYPIFRHWSVVLDVQYALQANRPNAANALQQRDHYVQVLPRVQYLPWPRVGVSLGGYAGRYLFGQIKQQGTNWIKDDFAADRPNGDVGLTAGLEVRFGRLTSFVRYLHGFTSVDSYFVTNDIGLDLGMVHLRNRYLQAGIGYTIFE